MTIAQIESNLQDLVKNFSKDTFVFDLLLAYGFPKATITRAQQGDLNRLESQGEFYLRKKLFFKESEAVSMHAITEALAEEHKGTKQAPRFVVITDYKLLLAIDLVTNETLDIDILDLVKHYDFFLPWAGMERAAHQNENPADVKAAEKMAKLYDEIVKENDPKTKEEIHALNVFLTRLLFCYFAEDTNIFKDNQFTNAIDSHTQSDGSDVHTYIERIFDVLNIKDRDPSLPEYLKAFPYVNGGLFKEKFPIPRFITKSRKILIEVGELSWSEINPDIFGSMIQAVVTPDHRGGMGMHYTSVPNIMKVIEPLFLDELYEEYEKSKTSKNKLLSLQQRLANIKIFDPACGSGNFLIIAYKELRALEMLILKQIDKIENMKQGELFESAKKPQQMSFMSLSSMIELKQFYGIELDDFAHEVAILSLWLTEHQMNMLFFKEFGQTAPPLPLPEGGQIVQGNATRLNWKEICPCQSGDEVYILGNPPYQGARKQNSEQKDDLKHVFSRDLKKFKDLDYIACWFYKGAEYIKGIDAKVAFVSTNSISQGEQVALLWPYIFKHDIEINFAYQSFKWKNNAKQNAAVIVVIIGLSNSSDELKNLFLNDLKHNVKNINAYLVSGTKTIVNRRTTPISNLPKMPKGNMPYDGGSLILSTEEKDRLIEDFPDASRYIKKLVGAVEFINNIDRWCLWIRDEDYEDAMNIDPILKRINAVKEMRLSSSDASAHKLAERPHQFREINETTTHSIVIPLATSERRKYVPIGFIDSNVIVSNLASVIYNVHPWVFSVISSHMHMLWMRTVAGRLKTDYRYSPALVYNNFPFPKISNKQKQKLTQHVYDVLNQREAFSEKTLGHLYDPTKMPESLKEAHHDLDIAVEKCYRSKPFKNDEERLEYLFKLYEKMTAKERK